MKTSRIASTSAVSTPSASAIRKHGPAPAPFSTALASVGSAEEAPHRPPTEEGDITDDAHDPPARDPAQVDDAATQAASEDAGAAAATNTAPAPDGAAAGDIPEGEAVETADVSPSPVEAAQGAEAAAPTTVTTAQTSSAGETSTAGTAPAGTAPAGTGATASTPPFATTSPTGFASAPAVSAGPGIPVPPTTAAGTAPTSLFGVPTIASGAPAAAATTTTGQHPAATPPETAPGVTVRLVNDPSSPRAAATAAPSLIRTVETTLTARTSLQAGAGVGGAHDLAPRLSAGELADAADAIEGSALADATVADTTQTEAAHRAGQAPLPPSWIQRHFKGLDAPSLGAAPQATPTPDGMTPRAAAIAAPVLGRPGVWGAEDTTPDAPHGQSTQDAPTDSSPAANFPYPRVGLARAIRAYPGTAPQGRTWGRTLSDTARATVDAEIKASLERIARGGAETAEVEDADAPHTKAGSSTINAAPTTQTTPTHATEVRPEADRPRRVPAEERTQVAAGVTDRAEQVSPDRAAPRPAPQPARDGAAVAAGTAGPQMPDAQPEVHTPAQVAVPRHVMAAQWADAIRTSVLKVSSSDADAVKTAVVEVPDERLGRIRMELALNGTRLAVHIANATPEIESMLQSSFSDLQQHLSKQNIDLAQLTAGNGGGREDGRRGRDGQGSQGSGQEGSSDASAAPVRRAVHDGQIDTIA